MNIDKAQQQLKENILDRLIMYENKSYTRRDFVTNIIKAGGYAEVKQVPSVQYNRRQYNNMNQRQQEEFDKKYNIKKNEYRLYKPDESFFTVTKTEYDFAIELKEALTSDEAIKDSLIENGCEFLSDGKPFI